MIRIGARTFTACIRSHCSSVISSILPAAADAGIVEQDVDAAELRPPPHRRSAGAHPPSVMSISSVWPPFGAARPFSGRSTASTAAPSAAKSAADALPIPEAAPVTIARRPSSLPAITLSSVFVRACFHSAIAGAMNARSLRQKSGAIAPIEKEAPHARHRHPVRPHRQDRHHHRAPPRASARRSPNSSPSMARAS